MSLVETCARAAYEMRRAVVQHSALKRGYTHVAERAFPAWDALPFSMRDGFIAQTKRAFEGPFDAHADVFDRYFLGAAVMTRNLLSELSPPVVCEHPAPPPPRPEAA